jgi:hypothetical protein
MMFLVRFSFLLDSRAFLLAAGVEALGRIFLVPGLFFGGIKFS